MNDNSNAGKRVLGARKRLRGTDDSLANILGVGIPDGAQCFVIDEQASYRFLKECMLAEDERFVVAAAGPGSGRWVRESGLVGFALLTGGIPIDISNGCCFGDFRTKHLVQFAMNGIHRVVYTGTVKRLAIVNADVTDGFATLFLNGEIVRTGILFIETGDQFELRGSEPRGSAALQVLLA